MSTASIPDRIIREDQKHYWLYTGKLPTEIKPVVCFICKFTTSNPRHIKNGFCRHKWKSMFKWLSCARCGVVQNDKNRYASCIGNVQVTLRGDPK